MEEIIFANILIKLFLFWKKNLAERSFDLRTSGLWAQHASTAPLCYLCLSWAIIGTYQHWKTSLWHWWVEKSQNLVCQLWDSNSRPQKWTATWTQRLRPLGHPDMAVNLEFLVYVGKCFHCFLGLAPCCHCNIASGSLAQLVRASC